MRNRYDQLTANIAHYEDKVASQSSQLDHMNQPRNYDDFVQPEQEQDMHMDHLPQTPTATNTYMTAEDLRREEEEIRALEQKRRALEERVSGMERDIGGLMR